jgi:hypothetical protein
VIVASIHSFLNLLTVSTWLTFRDGQHDWKIDAWEFELFEIDEMGSNLSDFISLEQSMWIKIYQVLIGTYYKNKLR